MDVGAVPALFGLVVAAGSALCRSGDAIADKTGVSGSWIGLIPLAVVTSLPELITGASAVTLTRSADIAVGDVLGSCVFNLSILAVLDRFATDAAGGLSEAEARSRLAHFGGNTLPDRAARGPWRLALVQFSNFMTLLLLAAAAVAGAVGDAGDSIAIVAVVILNAIVGFVQEYRAQNALAALRRMSAGQTTLLREGTARAVPAEAVVPGDIVLLEAGNAVPADLRLIEAHSLKLGEAALTGESMPVEKSAAPLPDPDLALGDRVNIAFRGTNVLFGRGLPAVETLGSVTVICSDKTGTLTENRMRATEVQIWSGRTAIGALEPARAPDGLLLEAMALCGDVVPGPDGAPVGDHPATALAIARTLGIAGAGDAVTTGRELSGMSDAELDRRIGTARVFARVDPAQKIRIVQALQRRGELVAMTGDGVNDAPALARADIGVAMGRGGTDVAREAAGLVLLDDNFATIVAAVREGRRIYDNIRKFVRYAVTCNSAEIWTVFLAPFLGLPVPLLPIQILWINLVTDGLPGLALAAEPAERQVMRRPPRPPGESLFARGLGTHVIWVGLLMAGITLLTQAVALTAAPERWQTIVFTVLTFAQMGHALAIRSEREPLSRLGLGSNPFMLGAVLITFALHAAVIYVPALNGPFGTVPLTAAELLACVTIAAVALLAVEAEKAFLRRREARAGRPGDGGGTGEGVEPPA